jgi:hypothetical protein
VLKNTIKERLDNDDDVNIIFGLSSTLTHRATAATCMPTATSRTWMAYNYVALSDLLNLNKFWTQLSAP